MRLGPDGTVRATTDARRTRDGRLGSLDRLGVDDEGTRIGARERDFGSDDDDDDDDDGGPVGWFIPDGGFGTDPNAPIHPTVEAARLGGVERSDWAKDDDETRGGLR